MEEINQRANNQSNVDCKKRRSFLAKKIAAILSIACGSPIKPQENEKPISKEHQLALNKTHPCEEVQVAKKVHARDGQSGNAKKRCKKQSPKAVPSSLSGIFTKGTAGFNLGKWRTVKTGCANGNGNGSKGGSSLMKAKVELKRDVSRREKKTSREEAKEEGNNREMELCKKRILMGGKCRPLNPSGVLHYDKQGILLPEDE
ncbi:hypothetical protein DH2020_047206 [Rehmannia glutinosa]|uniref:Uncharacterized protein n=1 Tax=Rehmannia glutinosa TaxID=99300 RepID=A0ABR0U9R1_REHGL